MKARDLTDLLLLAALWGASFLFMRVGAPAFGPAPMAAVRVGAAALVLLPLLAWRGELPALRRHWRPIGLVGLTNSALPFALYGLASLSITGGLASVFNAATPLFTGLLAWLWLRDPPTRSRAIGLGIGLAGVLGLAWMNVGPGAGVKAGADRLGLTLAVGACLLATLFYGFSANFTKRHLAGVPSMALATGSQVSAALALAVPAWWWWPTTWPGAGAWAAVLSMGLLSSALAYVLYFRLIKNVGATGAASVTFLVPVFAIVWGALLLDEAVTPAMVAGGAVILFGTSLAIGLWPRRRA